ncbi:DNA oxidative demethylase ALKBH2 [Ornithorhynchus anatinus]|uniref:DNA oxidative demethylase ALKBH2 n=1 Tax=Ornithorhynchus anatinus TaxID=9258 RepID=F7G2Z3_ORNAN|nr:DNA oxidative demethylase ALKBH2 [Ornithorhynchus anatinus]XP_028905141.1 DNA oxidative demethylase ALKBH2 [Ornithorhynchus anatinus]
MDRFLVKGARGCSVGKGPREQLGRKRALEHSEDGQERESEPENGRENLEKKTSVMADPSVGGYRWQQIKAEGLDCDYAVLFGRAEADGLFQELEREVEYFTGDLSKVQVFGKWHSIPRKQATYGDSGLSYTFSGLTLSPKPWIPVTERIRDRVSRATGHNFNFVLVNRYQDGHDHIGEHRDDERELAPRSPIASVSFGACRDFCLRHRDSRGKKPSRDVASVKLQLAHGSILLMNYPTNIYWYHSLPVRKKVRAPRINLTFRTIASPGK